MIKSTQYHLYLGMMGSLVITLADLCQANPTFGLTPPGSSSSSSSSSSFSSSNGSGSSSRATATSPTGVPSSSSATVFTPGATSSSGSATATSSTTAPNTTSATVNTPAVTVTNPAFNTPINQPVVVNVPTATVKNPSVVVVLSGTTTSSATFISAFSLPAPQQGSQVQNTSGNTAKPRSFTVQGLPSRVFPGLGLRLVSTNSQ